MSCRTTVQIPLLTHWFWGKKPECANLNSKLSERRWTTWGTGRESPGRKERQFIYTTVVYAPGPRHLPTVLADTGPTRTPLPDHSQETKLVTCFRPTRVRRAPRSQATRHPKQHRTPAGQKSPAGRTGQHSLHDSPHQLNTKEPPVNGVPLGKS